MASSGSFNTNAYGDRYLTFNWSVASQDIANNRTTINYNLVGAGGGTGNWYKAGNFKIVINGTTVYETSQDDRITLYNGTVVTSGQFTIGHDGSGAKSFSASAEAGIYTYARNVSGSGSWSLPTIPRQANLTSAPDFNDEANPTINYSNPAGNNVSSLDACISLTGARDDISYRAVSKTGSSYTFNLTTAERNVLRNACTNSNTLSVIFYLRTVIGGNTFHSTITKTMTIVNGNPTFSASNVSYQDSNSTTVNVTGNNQKLVQSLSNLLVAITSATAKKGASISRYEATINGTTRSITSAGNIDFGTINSANDLTLSVKAIDSRGNSTTATKTVTFLAWTLPTGVISLKRKNNYEDESYLKVNATYSSVDSKNTITVKYQYKKTTASSYSSATTMTNGSTKTLTLSKDYAWDFKITLTDKFGTTTYNTVLAKGKFILFVDTKKLSVGVNCFPSHNEALEVNGELISTLTLDKIYPVGSIYMSVKSTSPATLFGGSWTQLKDRFLLGAGSTYTAGNTGGASTVTLTVDQMPSHNHGARLNNNGGHNHVFWFGGGANSGNGGQIPVANSRWGQDLAGQTDGSHDHGGITVDNKGGGKSHNKMPPYLVVYMWKRTA